ncbi:MAG: NGG1p interacting factor NIF3 [Candidatus Omnitrophica bacterium]|nr:NGG1p interacting factor NIF3 [Candidatus Omnitrophota bacterium]
MKLGRFYNLIVKFGSERDPRKAKTSIKSYADSAVLYGDLQAEVKKILIGIDMETAELLLADKIRADSGLDLAISHHPEGKAYASLHEVMRLQADMLEQSGVSLQVAQKLVEKRMQEVERRILSQNHMRVVDCARLLNMPFMCMHTPADNHVFVFLKKLMQAKKPKKVKDIVNILSDIPEYRDAVRNTGCGPRIILGSPNKGAGKIIFEMTGGTEGPKNALDKLYKAGVRTIISMHSSEEYLKKAKDAGLNIVIAGHISSDSLGINLLLDRVEREEALEVIGCSGFKRIKRI